MADIGLYLQKIQEAVYGEEVRGSIHDAIQAVNESAEGSALSAANSASTASTKAGEADTSAASAANSASTASTKANAASTSATNAANSAASAANSASTASTKASEAATSESNAATSASNAATSASTATTKANAASTSATNAANSATSAANSASTASTKASAASTSATNANNSATSADTYAKKAQSYAVGGTGTRAGEDSDNAKDYYEKSLEIYNNFNSSGSVHGVKGNAETDYRTGNVNITPENIGMDACENYWLNTSNGTYRFMPSGGKMISNNKGVKSSTAESTWKGYFRESTAFTLKYRVSSEASYDKLTVKLDGVTIVNAISGEGSEETYTTTLSEGVHTLYAKYVKDSSQDKFEDMAFLEFANVLVSYSDISDKIGVSGVKGDAETKYREGQVNITKENIGLGNLENERQYSASNPQQNVSGSSGSCTGNAASATKLATARNIKINLASENGADFDGSKGVNPGVYGTLPLKFGGTGATTPEIARKNLGVFPYFKVSGTVDLNNLKEPGVYTISRATYSGTVNVINAPNGDIDNGATLIVLDPSNYDHTFIQQIFIEAEYDHIYFRSMDGDYFGFWYKIGMTRV